MTARLPTTHTDLPLLRLIHIHRLEPAFDKLTLVDAWQRRCALFRHEGRFIAVRVDPLAIDLEHWLEQRAGGTVEWYRVAAEDLNDWFGKQAEVSVALKSVLARAKAGDRLGTPQEATSLLKIGAGDAARPLQAEVLQLSAREAGHQDADALTRLVTENLVTAMRLGASEVHFESVSHGLVVRQRIDGVLETTCELAGREMAARAIAHLKSLVVLDGTSHASQGVLRLNDRQLPVRLSLLRGRHGEDAVLSIREKLPLVPTGEVLDIERLGFASAERASLQALVAQPYGLVLVAGPAGSGRTTTLFAMLAERCDGREKIVSVETALGPALPGVLQTTATEPRQAGVAKALQAALAHAPDRLVIDPLRDAACAKLALAAAMDGRHVLAAVGGNHVFDALCRFGRFGIDGEALAEALNGIVAQRLVRTVCPHCAEPVAPTAHELAALDMSAEKAIGGFRRGVGCGACRTTGYLGRQAIAEVLVLDESLRTLIAQRAPLTEIRAQARRQGLQSLREAALQLARAGLTTLEEVARVTRAD